MLGPVAPTMTPPVMPDATGVAPAPPPTGATPTSGMSTPVPTTTGTAGPVEPAPVMPPVAGQCLSQTNLPDEDGNIILMANEANNYSFSSTIQVASTVVKSDSEIFFDWSALTEDFMGHDLDPMGGVDMVSLLIWKLPHEEMQNKLNADELGAGDTVGGGVIALYTLQSATSGSIFEFNVPGNGPRDPNETEEAKAEWEGQILARLDPTEYDPAIHTYTVMVNQGYELGAGVKMVQAFSLDPDSTNTEVVITPDSATLSYTADMTTLAPVQIPAGTANILVNWEEIATNALGREFEERSIEEVMVAKYSLSPAELQTQFLDLEIIADEMYRGPVVAGEELVLSDLSDANGMPFTGITADGTWIVALVCGYCGNPAPWYITLVQACPAQ